MIHINGKVEHLKSFIGSISLYIYVIKTFSELICEVNYKRGFKYYLNGSTSSKTLGSR